MKTSLPAVALRFSFLAAALFSTAAAHAAEVDLHWLDGTSPPSPFGVSWGVPWPQGTVQKDQAFSLATADGKGLPLQSWTLAYWPDGSIKFTGFATTAAPGMSGNLKLSTTASAANATTPSIATDNAGFIQINTGPLTCAISKSGANLIDWMAINGYTIAQNGQLVCILQNGPQTNPEDSPTREKYLSSIKTVTLEQNGPVRAVVKIDGFHKGATSGREWLPFSVRLYFYQGQTAVRLVHTITFDGDQEKDFIRGLGVEFAVPLRELPANRHVTFAGEGDGLWNEPLQPGGGNAAQEANQATPGARAPSPDVLEQNAVWDDFKLSQPTPDGFTIVKRTNPKSTWLFSAAGNRATGMAYVGDLSGGFGLSVKNFWQSYPSGLEVDHASSTSAEIIAWLWSPDAPEMDMRHYDVRAHGLNASYEDVQPGLSTAYGVARTSELTLYPTANLPARTELAALAKTGTAEPLLACTPEYIHSTGVFGVWSLPDRSTPYKKAIEDGLDAELAFYEKQVDERDWYGYWQFGDFMHSYSAPRHEWNYDWGGHAWDNTELAAPLWLWYSYLRTGRADLFRLAEDHARNTSETNVYHLGPLDGLGTRHNVIKWGDGSKEVRQSQAAHWRFFYYLTTDERTGDIMHDMAIHADQAIVKFDPMREAEPPVPGEPVYAARLRIGPDWFALAGDWMTEWERTGDTKWRDRILAGADSILAMPYWFRTGQFNGLNPDRPGGGIGPLKGGGSMTVGFDIDTGKLTAIRDPLEQKPIPVDYNLATIQGGGEVMFELVPLLGRKDFATAWLQYCRLTRAPADMLDKDRITGTEGADGNMVETGQSRPRLAAYAYAMTKNPAFAQLATSDPALAGLGANSRLISGPDAMKPMDEAAGVSTNVAAQASLAAIEVLELCKDALPTEALVNNAGFGRRGGGGRGGRGGAPGANGAAGPGAAPAAGSSN
jgi:hypothetical protein